jgi:DNA-binding beta-propeller fold protein YncE/mono/diheme cytochrome c family protein
MTRRWFLPAALLPLLLVCQPSPVQPRPVDSQPATASRPTYKSPLGLAVDPDGRRAYVALHTAGAVAVVDLDAGRVLREIAVDRGPHDVVRAGGQLFVTCEDSDTLVRVDLERRAVAGRWRVGQAPRGVMALPDGSRVFVACHDAKTLHVLDVATGKARSLPLPGWPDRLVLHRDAEYPYVLALSSEGETALVSLVDTRLPPRLLTTSRLADCGNPRGLASRPGASSYVLVVHQKPRTKIPTTQIAQGWVFTNAISSFSPWGIDTQPGEGSRAKVLDDPRRGYADPSDVVLLPDQRHALVACAGADTVLALRTDRFVSANYGPIDSSGTHPEGKDDLALSRLYVGARVPTQANPRRLAFSGDGRILVVSNYLGDSLTVVDARTFRVLRHVPLGGPEPDAARRGEILFHSGRMTFQGQFTCASCHPGGGSDGLTWDLTRDGVGNFMNTRALWGVRDTAPYGWMATSPTLADRVAGTLRTLQRHEPKGNEVADLVAYLQTLDVPRPLPPGRADGAARARGKALFEGKGRCATCHRGEALHDTHPHDVGTRVTGDTMDHFDTPSLRAVARTAPYLHHGKAATLEEVFTRYNPQHRHGGAHLLSAEELADLITYLKGI